MSDPIVQSGTVVDVFVEDKAVTADEANRILSIAKLAVLDEWPADRLAGLMTIIRMANDTDMSCFGSCGGMTAIAAAAANAMLGRLVIYDQSAPFGIAPTALRVAREALGNTNLFATYRNEPMLALGPDLPFGSSIVSLGSSPIENDLLLALSWTAGNPQTIIVMLPKDDAARGLAQQRITALPGRRVHVQKHNLFLIDRLFGSQLARRIETSIQE